MEFRLVRAAMSLTLYGLLLTGLLNTRLPFTVTEIDGAMFHVCYDTGSVQSFLSLARCKEYNRKFGIQNGRFETEDKINLRIRDAVYDCGKMAVINFPPINEYPYGLIVGCDMMHKHRLTLDFCGKNPRIISEKNKDADGPWLEHVKPVYHQGVLLGLIIRVRIARSTYSMMIDTGSNMTLISNRVVAEHQGKMAGSPRRKYTLHFEGKTVDTEKVTFDEGVIDSELLLPEIYAYEPPKFLDRYNDEGVICIGVIGTDALLKNRVEIDMGNLRISKAR